MMLPISVTRERCWTAAGVVKSGIPPEGGLGGGLTAKGRAGEGGGEEGEDGEAHLGCGFVVVEVEGIKKVLE